MKLLLTIALLFTFTSHADTFDKQFNESFRKGPCKRLKLTADQKATLKEKMITMKHNMIDLKAAMKHARLDFKVAIMAEDATVDSLAANMDAIADAKTNMVKARLGFVADVALNVFTTEQKKPGLRCMRKMMRKMRGHRRGGRGHRRGMRPQA
jgi:hypothetical protein